MQFFEKDIDLAKLIKRLELINNLISLGEEEEVLDQVPKLEKFENNGNLNEIIALLKQRKFSHCALEIEKFLSRYRQLNIYVDPEIDGLRLEIKSLEKQINKLSNEKAEIEKIIYEFEVRHNHELGEIILKILEFRRAQAKGTKKQNEANKDYEEYNQEYETIKNEKVFELTEVESKELKNKYRKATKICHPDVVNENQKEKANEIFSELSAAYEKNDLKKVSQILEQLERGDFFVSKSISIDKKEILKVEIEKLKIRINELSKELEAIKTSETYKAVSSIKDMDQYFENTRQELLNQLNALKGE
jgi:hypothetical protein